FSAEPFSALLLAENRRDVFATTHFNKPPQAPVESPKPKTRSVSLTYLGLVGSSNGEPAAFVRVDQAVMKFAPGAKVVHDWALATADGSALVLPNGTQTNQIAFRQVLQLTVPLPE